jgi:hypothetical protein
MPMEVIVAFAHQSIRSPFPQTGPSLSRDRLTGGVPGSKSGIGVRLCPQIAPPWPKLTPDALSGRRARAVEREDEGPRPQDHLGRVLPGRDQDCVGIGQHDDQNLGFGCAASSKIAPPWPKLTPDALSGRCAGAVEREDERARRLDQVGGIFPGRDQDCVRIGRQDDQSLGFGCAAALQIAPPWPKLTPAGLSGRRVGADEREDECP